MRTRWLLGLAVVFAAGVVSAQQAAPAQPAADPSTVQPTNAQTGASPAATQAPETSSQPSSGDPATSAAAPATASTTTPAEGAAATAPAAAVTPVAIDWSKTAPGDAAAGEAKAAACGACHGLDGNSADAMYPKIAGQHEWYIARQLALYKSGERPNPIMMGFAAPLTPQDMRDLGAFFASKQVVPGLASDAPVAAGSEETWAARGQRLYRAGDPETGTPACMACHGPGGRGNPGAKYPALGGQHTDYTKLKLTEFRDGAVWGAGDNASVVMSEVAKSLDDADIEALSTYLEGLHVPARGGAAAAGGAR